MRSKNKTTNKCTTDFSSSLGPAWELFIWESLSQWWFYSKKASEEVYPSQNGQQKRSRNSSRKNCPEMRREKNHREEKLFYEFLESLFSACRGVDFWDIFFLSVGEAINLYLGTRHKMGGNEPKHTTPYRKYSINRLLSELIFIRAMLPSQRCHRNTCPWCPGIERFTITS